MSRRSPAGLGRRRARRPLLLVVGLAWVTLVAVTLTTTGAGHGHVHGGHAAPGAADGAAVLPVDPWLLVVMVVAMMGPLLIDPLHQVTQRTFPRLRRRRATAVAVGYLGPWLLASAALAVVADRVGRSPVGPGGGLLLAVALAVAWQCTPAKRRCLNRTHRHGALVARAHRGDVAALGGGAAHAGWCIASCGPVMLVASAAGHGLAAMAGAALWVVAEHLEPARRPGWGPLVPLRLVRTATNRLVPAASPAPLGG